MIPKLAEEGSINYNKLGIIYVQNLQYGITELHEPLDPLDGCNGLGGGLHSRPIERLDSLGRVNRLIVPTPEYPNGWFVLTNCFGMLNTPYNNALMNHHQFGDPLPEPVNAINSSDSIIPSLNNPCDSWCGESSCYFNGCRHKWVK